MFMIHVKFSCDPYDGDFGPFESYEQALMVLSLLAARGEIHSIQIRNTLTKL